MRLAYRIELCLAYLFYATGIYWFRKRWLSRRGARVVLVYHRVLEGRAGLGEMVGEQAFDEQMRYLRAHCRPVTREALLDAATAGRGVSVLVTFDDGYRDNFTRALPVLEQYGVPAVFFTVTDLVFGRRRIEPDVGSDAELFPSAEELMAARDSGIAEYGNHTATHRIVSTLGPAEFAQELRTAQEKFEERLGVTPRVFAYPRGRREDVPPEAPSVLQDAGFEAAFTMVPGQVDGRGQRFLLPRIGVSHVNDLVLFRVKMLGLLNPLVKLKNALKL